MSSDKDKPAELELRNAYELRIGRLYKYMAPDHVGRDDLLGHETAYFAKPSELNDPFECRPHIPEPSRIKRDSFIRDLVKRHESTPGVKPGVHGRRHLQAKLDRDFLSKTHQKSMENTGIFCVSRRNDILPLWSLYADGHKGFCVEIETTDNHMDPLTAAFEVIYRDDRPIVSIDDIRSLGNDTLVTEQAMANSLCTKSAEWSFEHEFRAITVGFTGKRVLPSGSISRVFLGARASDETVEAVRRLLAALTKPPELLKARLCRHTFSLQFEAI